jgi:hypothetical protein
VLATSASVSELLVHFLNADSVLVDGAVVMRLCVTAGGQVIPGASLISRLRALEGQPTYSQAMTDGAGMAEMRVPVGEATLQDADILVEATHGGRSARRKFRLRQLLQQ